MAKLRFISSDMPGAPVLTSASAGAFSLLSSLLTSTGGTTQTATAVTITSNLATITTSLKHRLVAGCCVTISGSTLTAINSTFTVVSTPTDYTFVIMVTAANAGSSVAFTYKLTGMGWGLANSNTPALRVSSSSAVSALNRQYIFDDTDSGYLRVAVAKEAIGPADFTIDQSLPGPGYYSGECYWRKTHFGDGVTTIPYVFFGDPDCCFYLITYPNADCLTGECKLYAAGAYKGANPGDTSTIILTGEQSPNFVDQPGDRCSDIGSNFKAAYTEGSLRGIIHSSPCAISASLFNTVEGQSSGKNTSNISTDDGKLYVSNLGVFDRAGLRGWLGGIYFIHNPIASYPLFSHLAGGYPTSEFGFAKAAMVSSLWGVSKMLIYIRLGPTGAILVDASGDWRS